MKYEREAARMPREVRQVFTLRKVYGHSPAQIAEEMHLTPAQVQRDLELAALELVGLQGHP